MDDSRFDALARALSRRVGRRAFLAVAGFVVAPGVSAKKRKRLRLGKTCDGVTDKCTSGECIEGVCACAEDEEPCRGRCVPLDTCCPRRRPRRCGNQCIPKKSCCRADNECPCGGGCVRCGQCCTDADCPGGPDPCTVGVCGKDRRCSKVATPGKACTVYERGVCNAAGRCVIPSCESDADCPLLVSEDSRCAKRRCLNGRCDPHFQPMYTPLGNFTVGDCRVEVCDGSGGIMSVSDDQDPPPANQGCPRPRCDAGQGYCS